MTNKKNLTIKVWNVDLMTIYPTNFDKQKVRLCVDVFNGEVVAQLEMNGRTETARFVQLVSRMIKILNIRTTDMERRLRDPYRAMDNKHSRFPGRVMNLTDQTSNALDVSITGVQALIKLLIEKGMDYCLTVEFQSDRIEGEFGTWRQMNGGNYYMSMDNIQSCMELQRLKLCSRHQQEETVWHARNDCCENPLSDEELDAVDDCFENADINDIELSTLYFISGYVEEGKPRW